MGAAATFAMTLRRYAANKSGRVIRALAVPKTVTNFCVTLTLAVVFCLISPGSGAVCPEKVNSEQALWNVHNCRPEFREWFRIAFNLQQKHWDDGWGWDECDPKFAFPKMMNSAYLLTYGLLDDTPGPWHSNEDYYTWASGRRHRFEYNPVDTGGAYAQTSADMRFTDSGRFGLVHRVEMNCPVFTISSGFRAGNMLHESTHVIYWRWDHQANNPGSNCYENCSDDWYFHALDAYDYGQLQGHTHSMNQIEIEFLCDLSEFPEPWVPAGIPIVARVAANSRMNNRIVNPPGWVCGEPRPLFGGLPASSR